MITFENVVSKYDGRDIFKSLSLSLAHGSFHFLTGPSGSGKTTLIRLAAGEILPTEGSIRLLGINTRKLSPRDIVFNKRRVGIIHQNCQFLEHLTLEENITLPLTVAKHHIKKKEMDELLRWVKLEKHRNVLPQTLSVGEKQRAALARAIITNPEIILADEPTGNLDWEISLRLLTLLAELNRLGKTIIVATHDLNLIRHVKSQVNVRILRIRNCNIQIAGAEL